MVEDRFGYFAEDRGGEVVAEFGRALDRDGDRDLGFIRRREADERFGYNSKGADGPAGGQAHLERTGRRLAHRRDPPTAQDLAAEQTVHR